MTDKAFEEVYCDFLIDVDAIYRSHEILRRYPNWYKDRLRRMCIVYHEKKKKEKQYITIKNNQKI